MTAVAVWLDWLVATIVTAITCPAVSVIAWYQLLTDTVAASPLTVINAMPDPSLAVPLIVYDVDSVWVGAAAEVLFGADTEITSTSPFAR